MLMESIVHSLKTNLIDFLIVRDSHQIFLEPEQGLLTMKFIPMDSVVWVKVFAYFDIQLRFFIQSNGYRKMLNITSRDWLFELLF